MSPRFCSLLILSLLWACLPLAAEPTPEATPAVITAQPYALAEAGTEMETTASLKREIDADLQSGDAGASITEELKAVSKEITRRMEATAAMLQGNPSLDNLNNTLEAWGRLSDKLSGWNRTLTARAKHLEGLLSPLLLQEQRWVATLADEQERPPELTARMQELIKALQTTRKQADQKRNALLALQNDVIEQGLFINQALSRLREARTAAIDRLLFRELPPFWSAVAASRLETLAQERLIAPLRTQWGELVHYTLTHPEAFLFHGLLLGLMIGGFYWLRARIHQLDKSKESNAYGWLLFERPVTMAVLLSLLCCTWIYPEAPRLFWAIWGAATLIPATLLLRRLLEPALFPILNTLVAFYFLDQVREVLAAAPLLARTLFILEMGLAAAVTGWILLAPRFHKASGDGRLWKIIRAVTRCALVLFITALGANIVGYGRLSHLIGEGTLRSAYLAATLYGGMRVLSGLSLGVLSFGPLAQLQSVRKHRLEIWARARRLLRWGVLLLWAWNTLAFFAMQDRVYALIKRGFEATLKIGSLSLSLENVAAFALAIWASFFVSRFIRFILEDDIYPRVKLARGLPYAISTVVHYTILLFGFFTATSALGFNLTQFTILAGAFGVGLGFGLQNIFNNFVSGLILLFERPIKIGDVIFFDGVDGVVRQIGIRASVIETRVGSEMIVPNGRLIAERITNWTHSNRRRGIEIPITLSNVTDPDAVIAQLKALIDANPGVAATPAPEVVVTKFSAGSAEFALRLWTNHEEQWERIRSDLVITIGKALTPPPPTELA